MKLINKNTKIVKRSKFEIFKLKRLDKMLCKFIKRGIKEDPKKGIFRLD